MECFYKCWYNRTSKLIAYVFRMRLAIVGLVLLALVIGDNLADARRKGEENWKQRYRKWKDSEEQSRHRGELIGTDEAAAARLHREVWL